jgi:hypothetical protein
MEPENKMLKFISSYLLYYKLYTHIARDLYLAVLNSQ